MGTKAEVEWISVLRKPSGLFVYSLHRREPFAVEPPTSIRIQTALSDLDPYREEIAPLREAPQSRVGPLKSALQSWDALGNVERLDADVLSHLARVLLHSLPEQPVNHVVAPLNLEPEAPAIRPTAANPRAYKGTKKQPPKRKKLGHLDLRPHLSSPRDLHELTLRLVPFQSEAIKLLRKEDLRLPNLIDSEGRPQDLYIAARHQVEAQSVFSLPALFRRGLLFWRLGEPWSHVGQLLTLYWSLDLEKRAPLRRCIERLFVVAPFSTTLEWCDLILEQPPKRQTAFTELLIETGAGHKPCPERMGGILRKLNDLTPDRTYRHRVFALLETVKKGGDPDYILAGMELAQSNNERHEFEPVTTHTDLPLESIRAIADHAADPYLGLQIWKACATLEGLGALIRKLPWTHLPPAAAKGLITLFTDIVYHDHLSEDERADKWAILRKHASALLDCLRDIPAAFQSKAIRHLSRLSWFWDYPDDLEGSLREYVRFVSRLCRSPFLISGGEEKAFVALTTLGASRWQRIQDAPEAALQQVEKACRRDNDAVLIASGLQFLCKETGDAVAEAFPKETLPLISAAKEIGGLGVSLRRKALQQWRTHALMSANLRKLPPEKFGAAVVSNLPKGMHDPVPRKLKLHVQGASPLSPGQATRAGQTLANALPRLQWQLLSHLCVEQTATSLHAPDRVEKVIHAVRFYGNIDSNRRALRRFLQAYFAGDKNYLRNHPVNAAWLKRQRKLRPEAWMGGMTQESRLADGSVITLHLELDPLETLRMGTYVGSCTGLGGSFAYSAAAVVLDINKRVLYARTENGAVAGRQLVGITDDEQLACFEVYPIGVSRELKVLFRDFDIALAECLGLEIHHEGEESNGTGKIETLLSREWWDDSVWDLEVGPDRPHPLQ